MSLACITARAFHAPTAHESTYGTTPRGSVLTNISKSAIAYEKTNPDRPKLTLDFHARRALVLDDDGTPDGIRHRVCADRRVAAHRAAF